MVFSYANGIRHIMTELQTRSLEQPIGYNITVINRFLLIVGVNSI